MEIILTLQRMIKNTLHSSPVQTLQEFPAIFLFDREKMLIILVKRLCGPSWKNQVWGGAIIRDAEK